MKFSTPLFAAVAALALSACSSAPRKPDYECPLDDVAAAKCASVQDAYVASNRMAPQGLTRLQSVFDPRAQSRPAPESARPVFAGAASEFPEPPQSGAPVFQQPQVMRVWVAPYVDADGHLRSGEYTYFSTPGQWNYGEMKKPGAAAAATFGPAKPGQLGFNPVLEPQKAPARPADGTRSGATAPQQAQQPAAAGGITQPFQRLTN